MTDVPLQRPQVSYDLIMEEDMAFVEGCFRLPGGEWQVVIVSRGDVQQPLVERQQWRSGVTGVHVRFPRYDLLNQEEVERMLSWEYGILTWERVRGPDSMQLR